MVDIRRLFLIVCISIVSAISLSAQRYIAISANLGEHSWVGPISGSKIPGSLGAGGGLGVHFEAQRNHFLFTLGVQGNVQYSAFMSEQQLSFWADDGDPQINHAYNAQGIYGNFTYQYDFYKRRDHYLNVALQVPLMLGGTWEHFYFLAGAKFQTMTLWAQSYSTTKYVSRGIYSGIYGGRPLEHMPEYGFYDEQVLPVQKNTAKFNINVLASAEIGYTSEEYTYVTLRNSILRSRWRIGAYFDYGLLNDYDFNQVSPAYILPSYQAATAKEGMKQVSLVPILSSNSRAAIIRPMQVGIKFTAMLELPQPKHCVICEQGLDSYRYW